MKKYPFTITDEDRKKWRQELEEMFATKKDVAEQFQALEKSLGKKFLSTTDLRFQFLQWSRKLKREILTKEDLKPFITKQEWEQAVIDMGELIKFMDTESRRRDGEMKKESDKTSQEIRMKLNYMMNNIDFLMNEAKDAKEHRDITAHQI